MFIQNLRLKLHKLNTAQIITLSFAGVIFVGGLILWLPFCTAAGQTTSFTDAMFTATTCVCVTGLVTVVTATHWTWIGKLVMLLLIQIGGIGLIALASIIFISLNRKISMRNRRMIQESYNLDQMAGLVTVVKKVILCVLAAEGMGAVGYAFCFVPRYGLGRGLRYAVFTAVSAFCNAGFDLMGINEEYSSFTKYAADPLVNITIMLLIIIGGIGFTIWNEVRTKKFKLSRYSLHAKIVISTTLILVFGGGLFLYIFEKNNTIAGMDTPGAIFASLFGSVTARTAGFNTVDTAALTQESKLLTIVLMFIGGSPGSTAGGIKTTTMAVMIIYIVSYMRGSNGCNVFGRKISSEVIKKAGMVLIINLVLGLTAVIAILATSNMKMDDVLFEVYSAISTVGMTTGITRDLNTVGRIIIIIMMYCGRIGSMTFVLSFVHRPDKANIELPEEKVIIG